MTTQRVRWGVLSTARIATEKVIPAMQRGARCEVVAIASRNVDAAERAAAELGIPKSYGTYEQLLADPGVDAIYNPLPNDLHVSWSIEALKAGKHVLCEKPIGMTVDEGQQLVDAAHQHPRLKVMEAFMYRHHPQWKEALALIDDEAIGQVVTIHSFFSYFNDDPHNIRNQAAHGGGGLMDIGCYPISLSRFIFRREPHRVLALADIDARFATDRLASAVLDFGAQTSTFTCSTQLVPYQRVNIFRRDGRIEIEIPFNAPPDRPCRLWLQQGTAVQEITFDVCDQYTLQGDAMSAAILDDTPVPTPITDAVANMRVIEGLKQSARSGSWAAM